jgi:hypothetical protein
MVSRFIRFWTVVSTLSYSIHSASYQTHEVVSSCSGTLNTCVESLLHHVSLHSLSPTERPVCVSPLNSRTQWRITELTDTMKNHGTRGHDEDFTELADTMKNRGTRGHSEDFTELADMMKTSLQPQLSYVSRSYCRLLRNRRDLTVDSFGTVEILLCLWFLCRCSWECVEYTVADGPTAMLIYTPSSLGVAQCSVLIGQMAELGSP